MIRNRLTIIRKLALAAAILVVSSCEVTDLTPANLVPQEEAYGTAARVEGTMLGVYEAAQRGFYANAIQRGYPFGAAHVEQGDLRGEDMYNDQLFYEITYTNAHGVNTANNNGMWISLYRLINRLNVVESGIQGAFDKGTITQEKLNAYKGELLFLRALAHHELLVHFSRPYSDNPSSPGVPYRTTAIDDVGKVKEGIEMGRGTIAQAYTKLLADLDMAEQLMPADEGTNTFRARKGAVIALKSRVKLHMKDWAGVIAEYQKIKDVYSLTATPGGAFAGGRSAENIFFFQNSAESNPGTNGALPSMYGDPSRGGRGLVKISPIIWNADFWHADDLRRGMASINKNGIYTLKYSDYTTFSDPSPILRHSEVILNATEAYARQGNLPVAVQLLNQVRDRALPEEAASYTVESLGGNQAGVLKAVLNERRVELLAEGRRWADIHRLSGEGLMAGIPAKAQSRSVTSIDFYTGAKTVTLDHSLEYSNNLFIWPIPQDEVVNNPTLAEQQNPGY